MKENQNYKKYTTEEDLQFIKDLGIDLLFNSNQEALEFKKFLQDLGMNDIEENQNLDANKKNINTLNNTANKDLNISTLLVNIKKDSNFQSLDEIVLLTNLEKEINNQKLLPNNNNLKDFNLLLNEAISLLDKLDLNRSTNKLNLASNDKSKDKIKKINWLKRFLLFLHKLFTKKKNLMQEANLNKKDSNLQVNISNIEKKDLGNSNIDNSLNMNVKDNENIKLFNSFAHEVKKEFIQSLNHLNIAQKNMPEQRQIIKKYIMQINYKLLAEKLTLIESQLDSRSVIKPNEQIENNNIAEKNQKSNLNDKNYIFDSMQSNSEIILENTKNTLNNSKNNPVIQKVFYPSILVPNQSNSKIKESILINDDQTSQSYSQSKLTKTTKDKSFLYDSFTTDKNSIQELKSSSNTSQNSKSSSIKTKKISFVEKLQKDRLQKNNNKDNNMGRN